MNTPIRIGDRVHNAVYGSGTVEGFYYPEGLGEQVVVVWDQSAPEVAWIGRYRLRRILRVTPSGSLVLSGSVIS